MRLIVPHSSREKAGCLRLVATLTLREKAGCLRLVTYSNPKGEGRLSAPRYLT